MNISLHVGDWVVIGLYVVATLGIALRVRMGQKTAADYFLAGRSMPWIVVGISLYATLFSTISFVAVPGEAFKNGVLMSLNTLGYAVFTPLAMWLFLRFFYQTNNFTCYEYLERRFNGTTRTLGSIIFLVTRAVFAATVFYAAAKIFEALVGWDVTTTILLLGTFAVAYTTIGGMRAVMITDVMQTLVLLLGMVMIFFKAASLTGFDFAGVWAYAREHDHTFGRMAEAEFYSVDPYIRYTLWVWLVRSIMGPPISYGADQLVVQRLLASKSYEQAKRAIWLKTLSVPPVMASFYFIGLMLFYYYGTIGELPAGFEADHVMGLFISQHLPTPIPGLVAAALMAALMSSVDSTVGSLSTVTSVDLLQRAGWVSKDDVAQVRTGKLLTIGWGVVVVGFSLGLARANEGAETTVMELAAVWSSLWGVLLMVMLAGVLTKWATPRMATLGLIVGMIVNLILPWPLYYWTPEAERISFAWVGIPGVLLTGLIVFGGSLFDRRKPDPDSLQGVVLSSVGYASQEAR